MSMITQKEIQERIAIAIALKMAKQKAREEKIAYRKRFMASTQEGYTVVYNHFRYDKHGKVRRFIRGESKWRPTLYGGLTVCVAVHKDTGHIVTGYGNCDPVDRFEYAEGRWYAWNDVYASLVFGRVRGKEFPR